MTKPKDLDEILQLLRCAVINIDTDTEIDLAEKLNRQRGTIDQAKSEIIELVKGAELEDMEIPEDVGDPELGWLREVVHNKTKYEQMKAILEVLK